MRRLIFILLVLTGSVCHAQDWLPRLSQAIVRVHGSDGSIGSGTVVQVNQDGSGTVVTAKHVVQSTNDVRISWRDGFSSAGTVVARGAAYDTAVIRVQSVPRGSVSIQVAEQEPQPDSVAIAIGYGGQYGISPQALRPVYWRSRVAGYANWADGTRPILLTGPYAMSGDSGGPILNEQGLLIGVITGYTPTHVLGPYCTPIRNLLFGRRPAVVMQPRTQVIVQRPG